MVGFRCSGSRVPLFGLGASTAAGPTPAGLPAVDVLVEPALADAGWRATLDRAALDAAGGRLDVRFVTDDADALGAALDALEEFPVVRARPGLAGVGLVAGSRAHFTELDRTLGRLPADAPAVTFSSTPQMHDTGRDQVLESLAVQRTTALQAVRVTGRDVHVGPVTLRPRFNAVATTECPAVAGPDPRQSSRGFAAWLVASAAELSVAGVASVAFAEVWGPRGVRAADGTGFPAAAAFALLTEVSGAGLLEVVGTLPDDVHVLAARRGEEVVVLVANVGDAVAVVRFAGLGEVVVGPLGVARTTGRVAVGERAEDHLRRAAHTVAP